MSAGNVKTIEGWPYRTDPRQLQGVQARYTRAVAQLRKADTRMRRAFHAWEKARSTVARYERALELEPHEAQIPHVPVVELDDPLP